VLVVTAASTAIVAAIAWAVVRPAVWTVRSSPSAATRFLERYVDGDGRVVRLDQGGDTVSEGQAYGMLLAVAAGDRTRFASTWHWTSDHLLQPDGLLAWHWTNGAVADPMAASDADVDAAGSLALAANRFGDREYREAARRLAGAVLERETVTVEGQAVLVAGPWAKTAPYTVNPGYLPAPAARVLAGVSGDDTWRTLEDTSSRLIDRLTQHGSQLPTDWAKVNPNGDVWPDAGPGRASGSPSFGLEAARVLLWNGNGCGRRWTGLVAAARPLMDGRSGSSRPDPVMVAARAAVANAAGDRGTAHRLVREAGGLDADHPTYFGGAWVGLAEALYTTHTLPSCGTQK